MTRTPIISAIGFALTLTLLLGGCGQPVATRTTEADPSGPVQERIQRVENGLIAVTAKGELEWGDPKTLAERMEHYDVPGVSIAVINDYQLEWARGYGVLEAGGNEPVTPDSLFDAGSIAKPVSAAAALVLVERGLLDLDQDVNDKLVSWQVPENEYTAEEKVTLRRLLSHSAGLTDGFPMRSSSDPEFDWWMASEGETPTITIQQLLEAQPPADEGTPTRVTRVPGTDYGYSNFGYGVVQLLMADVTHQPFSELMQETVLGPVGMTSSTFEQPLPEAFRDRATTEHYVNGQPFEGKRHHYPVLASSGLWTTPSDLARFAIEIMRARAGESDPLLSQEMAGEMLTTQIAVPESFLSNSYGLGFDLGGEGQEFRFMHTGGTWGSTCILWLHPATGQGAVIMTNSASGEGAIRFEILLSIAAEYGWPLALLPWGTIDLVVVVAANLFNLLMTAIFLTRPKGWKRFERVVGLIMVALALPLGAAVILNLLANREWWFVVLPLPLILHCIVELLLDYILKLDFRKTRLLGPYLALFYLGQMGLIGYAFIVEPAYGFATLATYFVCLSATRMRKAWVEQKRCGRCRAGADRAGCPVGGVGAMDLFEQALGDIQGGRVLDVATGRGGFVELLADRLDGYNQIVGVDVTARTIEDAPNNVAGKNVHFVQMDARRLGFKDGSFDTVSVSASLHHLADASPVFVEIGRMLKPGGHLVVAEMHRDVTTEAQLTSVRLHTWAAAVDSAAGLSHYPTLTRQQIVDLVEALDLRNISVYDWADVDSDPLDEERITSLEGVLERCLSKAQGLPDHLEIEAQAQALRRRLRQVGAQSEPRIVIVGQKPQ